MHVVHRIGPPALFSFRWHPYGIDPNVDYLAAPTTLVDLRLAEAFRLNEGGWAQQVENLRAYATRPA